MVSVERIAASNNGYVLIRPQRSSTWRQNMALLALIGAIYAATSVLLTMQGFWPVIPWAVLDLALLFGCLYVIARAGNRREVIRFEETEVRIERGRVIIEESLQAPRNEAYCLVRKQQRAGARSINVYLRLGRKTSEIGAALGPIERDQLVEALRGLLPVHEHVANPS